MKSWKRLEEYIPTILKDWKRLVKKSYGDSIPDLKGDDFIGECKNYKKFKLHSILEETEAKYQKYHADIILFTKKKGTLYSPENVVVHFRLPLLKTLLECYKVKIPDKSNKDVNVVDDKLTKDLRYQISLVKINLQKIGKILKELEEVK